MIRRNIIKQTLSSVLGILAAVALSLIFLKSTFQTVRKIQYGQNTLKWQEIPGKILSSKQLEQNKGRRTTTRYLIACQYNHEGHSYTTSNMGQGEAPRQLYQKTQLSRNLPVFVNPEHPANASMSQGVKKSLWFQLLLFFFLTTAPLWYTTAILRKAIRGLRFNCASRPRNCQWGAFSSPEEMINDIKRGNGQAAIIENRWHSRDLLYLFCNDEGLFYIVTGGDRDHPVQYISPKMNHKEVLACLKTYEHGLSRLKWAKNWQETVFIREKSQKPSVLSS